jgi:hypothetical protein
VVAAVKNKVQFYVLKVADARKHILLFDFEKIAEYPWQI